MLENGNTRNALSGVHTSTKVQQSPLIQTSVDQAFIFGSESNCIHS